MPRVEYLLTYTFHLDTSRSRQTVPALPDNLYQLVNILTDGDKNSLSKAIYSESSKFFGGHGINLRRDASAMEDNSKLDPERVYVFWHMVAYITCEAIRLSETTPGVDENGALTGEEVSPQ